MIDGVNTGWSKLVRRTEVEIPEPACLLVFES